MLRLLAVASVLAAALAWWLPSVAQAGTAGTPHYPDLVTLSPSNLRIASDKATGHQLLKFSNTIANLGEGRFELRPQNNPANGTTLAYQRVYTHRADGVWSLYSETPVGTFVFHPAHNHWHFEGFAKYELRNVAPGGGIGRLVVASSDKVSVCMVDTVSQNLSLEHAAPSPVYTSCGQSVTQGISVGWGDVYAYNLPGQDIDITHVQTGTYWLVSTADPDNRIGETNNANNSAAVLVTIRSSWKPKQ